MAENESRFVIAFDGKAGDLAAVMSALKRQIRSDVSEIEATLTKIDLFKNLQQQAKDAATAFFATKERVRELREVIIAIQGAGGTIGSDLAKQMKVAETAAASTRRELEAKFVTLKKLRGELTTAGVDVRNLAAAEDRLAASAKAAAAALKLQGSKDVLGLKTIKDIQPEISKLQNAYQALRASGTLSFGETQIAAARLQQGIAKLQAETGGIGQAFRDMRLSLIAFGVAAAGVGAIVLKSASNYRAFTQQIAAVDSIAERGQTTIQRMSDGVRDLARRIGVDAVEATKALYQIISSGIPAENAIQVLELSTRAAIAGLTSVDTAARAGVAVLNGYGLQVTELGRVFDVMFKTVQDGIITFPEFAKNVGFVVPAARAAGVSVETLGAAFVVVTRAGIEAPEAATAINRAIIDLAAPAPASAQVIRDLGLKLGDFVDVIRQVSEKKLDLEQITNIVPDQRGSRAILLLSQSYKLLQFEIEQMADSVGAAETAFQKLANTPQQKVEKFNAAMRDLSISIGEVASQSLVVVQALTSLLNAFNKLDPTIRTWTISLAGGTLALGGLLFLLQKLAVPLNLFLGLMTRAGLETVPRFTAGITAASSVLGAFYALLAGGAGFTFGKFMFENSESVRKLGDGLGLAAAGLSNLRLGLEVLIVKLFGTKEESARVSAEFNRNRKVIAELAAEMTSGLRERLRELSEVQLPRLREELGKAIEVAVEATSALSLTVKGMGANVDKLLTGLDLIIAKVKENLKALVASLAQSGAEIQKAATQGLANITAQVEARLGAIGLLQLKELDHIRAIAAVHAEAAVQRLSLIKTSSVAILKAFDIEATARIAVAKRAGEDIKKVESDLHKTRRDLLQGVVDQFRAHITQLVALEQGHLDKVKSLGEERKTANQLIQDAIRSAQRGTLTEHQLYRDKVMEIDELISRGRRELAAGDAIAAGETAKKVIGLAEGIKTAVVEDGDEVVSSLRAQGNAVSAITRAGDLLKASLDQRTVAEKEAAQAAKDGIGEAKTLLAEYQKTLDEVTKLAKEGVRIRSTLDQESVEQTLNDLQEKLDERKPLAEIQADVIDIETEIEKIRADLAKNGMTVRIEANLEAIREKLLDIEQKNPPKLNMDIEPALAGVEKLRLAVDKLKTAKMNIETNAAEVQKAIDNLKKDTTSTHTVKLIVEGRGAAPIEYKPLDLPGLKSGGPVGFKRGGLVRRYSVEPYDSLMQRYARGGRVFSGRKVPGSGETVPATLAPQGFAVGGSVFRKGKVPGSGERDTVPANLESGSFVLRKVASRFYGDKLIAALAQGKSLVQRFAKGGSALKEQVRDYAQDKWGYNPFPPRTDTGPFAPVIDPKKGFQSGDSFQSTEPPVNFDTRPVPEKLITALNVLTYAREMLNFVGLTNPLMGKLGPAMQKQIAKVEGSPNDIGEIKVLLQMAETLGANPYLFTMWEKTAGSAIQASPVWFIDWLEKNRAGDIAGDTGGSVSTSEIGTNSFAKRFFTTNPLLRGAQALLGIQRNRLVRADPLPPNLPYDPEDDPRPKGKRSPFQPFAKGGSTDIVQALLTPGEWVIKKPEVAKYGSGFMHDLNAMRVPRAALSAMVRTPRVQRFASGGDIVPALLTPGEWVMKKSVVAKYGSGLMHALNKMVFPRAALADMIRAPRVQRFADGGPVGDFGRLGGFAPVSGPVTNNENNININVSVADLFSEANVRRFLLPILNSIQTRST